MEKKQSSKQKLIYNIDVLQKLGTSYSIHGWTIGDSAVKIKVFDKYGRAFEPDFLLFCSEKTNQQLTFQVFIEPKGAHLIGYDKWKEDFLKEIGNEQKSIKIHTDTYKITAVPFYNYGNENEFKKVLENTFEN